MLLSVIESKLREIIQESVVLPHMDDVPFFDTSAYDIRGGIFDQAFSRPATTTTTTTTTIITPEKSTTTKDETSFIVEVPISLPGSFHPGTASSTSDAESDGGVLLGKVNGVGNVTKRRTWFGKRVGDEDGMESDSAKDRRRRLLRKIYPVIPTCPASSPVQHDPLSHFRAAKA